MLKCNICGTEFPPFAEKRYTAKDNKLVGTLTNIVNSEEKLYDAWDCPVCGSQIIAQERKRVYDLDDICTCDNKTKSNKNGEQNA